MASKRQRQPVSQLCSSTRFTVDMCCGVFSGWAISAPGKPVHYEAVDLSRGVFGRGCTRDINILVVKHVGS